MLQEQREKVAQNYLMNYQEIYLSLDNHLLNQWDINMEITLLNYEDKQTVISYDITNNQYCKIHSSIRRKGFYDIWDKNIFGVIVFNNEVYFFVETELIKFSEVSNIINNKISNKSIFLLETISGKKYTLEASIGLEFKLVIDSDYAGDHFEYNLGIYMEELLKDENMKTLFISNVIERGLSY